MSALVLRNRFQGNTTLVENEFIDNYMAAANGEFVKIYLLLLRHINNPDVSLSISRIADYLENTEGDVLRALKYWERQGLLKLEYDAGQNITGLELVSPSAQSTVPPAGTVPQASPEPVSCEAQNMSAQSAVASSRKSVVNRKELKQILFVAEQYLGKTLSRTDVDTITYFYDTLGFSADLIEYLIEYCVENGHRSMHYIQKVALSWADEHITSVEQAKNTSAFYNKTCYSILNAFGIKGRGPAASELEYIRKWTISDGIDLELILEACNRTMAAIHQPSFEYTDKILQNWRSRNVHTLTDVRVLDSAFEQEKNAQKKTPRRTPVQSAPSKFRSFEERSYDMDELTKELLRSN
ncbi:MAG: DnaD domain protein [Bariatricus sp.]